MLWFYFEDNFINVLWMFSSIQFNFICIAPNHNIHLPKALYKVKGQDLTKWRRNSTVPTMSTSIKACCCCRMEISTWAVCLCVCVSVRWPAVCCYFVDVFSYMLHLFHFCPPWERDPSHVALCEVSLLFVLGSFGYSCWGWRTEDVVPC